MKASSVTRSGLPSRISSQRSKMPSSASTAASTRSSGRRPVTDRSLMRGVATTRKASRPLTDAGPPGSRMKPLSSHDGRSSLAAERRLGSVGRLDGPAAVVPFGAPGPLPVTPDQVALALFAVTPAGRDQQREPARFGAKHLCGPFPRAPVSPRPPRPAEAPLRFPFLR